MPRPTPPPVVIAAPQARSTGWGWIAATFVLALLLALSVLGNLGGLLTSFATSHPGSAGGDQLMETVIEDNGGSSRIAVVDIAGVISSDNWDGTGNRVELIKEQLDRAADHRAVKAVILRIDSPGGEVLASDEIADAISAFQEETGKPVVACMAGVAASGGYYVSAPCRWIVAHELTLTGSIGVIMHGYNYRDLMSKVGIRPEVFKSGKFKDMLSGEKAEGEILPEERQMVQALINETYQRFKEVVESGRKEAARLNQAGKDKGRKLADNWSELADGRILSGKQAFEAGFVDELGNFDTAVARAEKLAGITNADLIRYDRPFEFSSLFRLFGKTDARSLKVQIGPDTPRLQTGRMYFLTPTALPWP
jgi:protease-4